MEKDAATVYCPNELCQAANPATNRFCQQCSTPIPVRYLWAVVDGEDFGNAGDILGDRYYVVSQHILLDTKPGLLPDIPDLENFPSLRPYLRLFPYRLNVPQVYGVLPLELGGTVRNVILLEKPPLLLKDGTEVSLHPALESVWSQSSSMRQLNWLWQIAQLWQPLASQGVASSLLDPLLLRAEGGILRVLELRPDGDIPPKLSELGEFWRTHFLPKCQVAIAEFVDAVCQGLAAEKIHSGEQLADVLDRGLAEIARHQENNVKIITKTDTGPQRQRNEDSCYPIPGQISSKPSSTSSLAVVCDGIGGHEGGNIASNLAIETVQKLVYQLTDVRYEHLDASVLMADLENAVGVANDKISQRNDGEQRSGRQRMGTTLVMALAIAHEMYITHVGDSRAYLITPHSCYQVTIDDDVASREVRLGYALYRDAVSQPASGSLVQALGMGSSNALHPTAQRFIVDEDCVFLLCSDGLSDYDRVEQHWETELLPIINENKDLKLVSDRLVEIANSQNGHDNVTVALISSQINYIEPEDAISPQLVELATTASVYSQPNHTANLAAQPNAKPSQRTQVLPDTVPTKISKLGFLPWVIVPLFFMAAIALGYWLSSSGSRPFLFTPANNPGKSPSPSLPPSPQITSNSVKSFNPGEVITTKTELKSLPSTNQSSQNSPVSVFIPPGTVLRVVEKETNQPELPKSGLSSPTQVENKQANRQLIELELCLLPEASSTNPFPQLEPDRPLPSPESTSEPPPPQLFPGSKLLFDVTQLTDQSIDVTRPPDQSKTPCAQINPDNERV